MLPLVVFILLLLEKLVPLPVAAALSRGPTFGSKKE
jgi:hypothetical protein